VRIGDRFPPFVVRTRRRDQARRIRPGYLPDHRLRLTATQWPALTVFLG